MAFLSVDNLSDIERRVQDQDFEALATIGPQNLIVTHLSESGHDMVYDIATAISRGRTLSAQTKVDQYSAEDQTPFPFLLVDGYFKILGRPIEPDSLSAFSSPKSVLPSLDEITKILRVGRDWNDDDVTKQQRNTFLKQKWILVVTGSLHPTSHILTAFLDHSGPELEDCQALFEKRVVAEILDESGITALYKGRPQGLDVHYVLRICDEHDSVYSLLKRITSLAAS